jgi:pyridoxamine 5'-phosphate oxidase
MQPSDEHARPLRRGDLDPDPLRQFDAWFEEVSGLMRAPEAAALATATADGAPSVRMVLVKRFDDRGLVFHTHATSRKGAELEANPHAALLFHWDPLGRQVRVEGSVERTSAEESDAYFATRPRGAQIAAHASRQSSVVSGREELELRVAALAAEFEDRAVPRPDRWCGYRLAPEVWEFWQHRDSRLHDRFRYRLDTGGWVVERLAP